MESAGFWTTSSIAVLIFGAPAVFVWFLRDLAGLLKGLNLTDAPPAKKDATEIPNKTA